MSVIAYPQLGDFLKGLESPDPPGVVGAVYLVFGDEMLVEKAFAELLDSLLPQEQRSFGYEPLDGAIATAADVVESINTYGLNPGLKLVAWLDAPLFRSTADPKKFLTAAQNAFASGEERKAAGSFLKYLNSAKLGFDDVGHTDRESGSLPGLSGGSAEKWVDELVDYCRQNGLKSTVAADQAELIKRCVEKGLPTGHRLVMTTQSVDRRQGLFKTVRDTGVVIDCSVPRGNRRADKQAQEKVLSDTMKAILKPHHKKMDRPAFNALCEKTGFDLRAFANNLEILIHFVGSRDQIDAADVATALQRTKLDPIYELTNAVSERTLEKALFFLDSLLGGEAHPLQILAALTNQVRRLLLGKDFSESIDGQAWSAGCTYNQFQSQVVPAMAAFDQRLLQELDAWQQELNPSDTAGRGKNKRTPKGASKKNTDLLVAKNPKNAYPLFLLLQKCGRFSKSELLDAIQALLDTDRHLKSSAQDPKLVLERLIMQLCGIEQKPPRKG